MAAASVCRSDEEAAVLVKHYCARLGIPFYGAPACVASLRAYAESMVCEEEGAESITGLPPLSWTYVVRKWSAGLQYFSALRISMEPNPSTPMRNRSRFGGSDEGAMNREEVGVGPDGTGRDGMGTER